MTLLEQVNLALAAKEEQAQAYRRKQAEEDRAKARERFAKQLGIESPKLRLITPDDRIEAVRNTEPMRYLAELEGIEFVYTLDYTHEGWYVLKTCPDCGAKVPMPLSYSGKTPAEKIANSIAGGYGEHHCGQQVMRTLTSQLDLAARRLGISRYDLLDRLEGCG